MTENLTFYVSFFKFSNIVIILSFILIQIITWIKGTKSAVGWVTFALIFEVFSFSLVKSFDWGILISWRLFICEFIPIVLTYILLITFLGDTVQDKIKWEYNRIKDELIKNESEIKEKKSYKEKLEHIQEEYTLLVNKRNEFLSKYTTNQKELEIYKKETNEILKLYEIEAENNKKDLSCKQSENVNLKNQLTSIENNKPFFIESRKQKIERTVNNELSLLKYLIPIGYAKEDLYELYRNNEKKYYELLSDIISYNYSIQNEPTKVSSIYGHEKFHLAKYTYEIKPEYKVRLFICPRNKNQELVRVYSKHGHGEHKNSDIENWFKEHPEY